jgi:pimeloyl-ACP methyl ester carboxylesterase
MTTYVLVPGFWLGAWAWDAVAEELRSDGHVVHPVDLGHQSDATAESHVGDILEALKDAGPSVLVGHSGAGPACVAAAERRRDAVNHLVLVDTGPLPDGMPQIDFNPPEAQKWIRSQIADNNGAQPMPTPQQFREMGTSTAGIDEETWANIRARVQPEPAGVIESGIGRGTPDPALPKTAILCSLTEEQVKGMIAAGVPGFAEMAGPEWSFLSLPTGHWPMFSEPVALARSLAAIG